ncbi:inorganic triphosphatase YgiF [Paraburkholderia sp. RAU2J]|uniref:CYTH and CHAD domain-containing protein n=1 Tax=Paraburkholderia sp. RAU2J TaxID=1938810 RepID=UPI000EB3D463|nr:CYTH and CHAD domain-containing protein [Paraburkholderia sp. RAU2J]RKT21776.1 inorganic triphosphatase YgiF [Paraburkholderia sp. RAU2J]
MERELKLRIPAEDLEKLRHAPLLAQAEGAAGAPTLLTSTYFDTPELAFHWCRASLRVRCIGDERLQTLKLEGSARAGLFDRDEFELPVDSDTPDLKLLQDQIPADTDCGRLICDESTAARLKPVFVTRINRSVIPLRLPSGDELEVALDEGIVEADSGSVRIAAVELELKQGQAESLYGLALELLDTVPLRIDHLSKADLGYELLVAAHSDAIKAQPVHLGRRDSLEDAFCSIAHNCLDQIHANERGVVSGHDPSCVHQMRVGLRRLRSALDLFAKVIPAYPGLDEELRWIASELGAARDWEVLAGSTLQQAATGRNADEIIPVQQACEQIAVSNRQRAAAAVESVRYTRLVLQVAIWLNRKGWREGMSDKQREVMATPAVQFAADVLRRRHRKLIQRGKRLADLDDHRRHRARIAAKKVRYATEFFASLCARRAVRHYVEALTALQDDLGWRNDVVVADQLLTSIARTSPDAATGAAFARGYLASRAAADHEPLKKLWKRFRRLSPPR